MTFHLQHGREGASKAYKHFTLVIPFAQLRYLNIALSTLSITDLQLRAKKRDQSGSDHLQSNMIPYYNDNDFDWDKCKSLEVSTIVPTAAMLVIVKMDGYIKTLLITTVHQ